MTNNNTISEYVNWDRIKEEWYREVPAIIASIKKYGGIIDEDAVPSFELIKEMAMTESPWTQEHLGYATMDEAIGKVKEYLSNTDQSMKSETSSFRGLFDSMKRQSIAKRLNFMNKRELPYDPELRFRKVLEDFRDVELPLYENDDPEIFAHMVGYLFNYSPTKSTYDPDRFIENIEGYGEHRDTIFNEKVADAFGKAFVVYQDKLGINEKTTGTLTRRTMQETDDRARQNNSKPATGYPLFKSGRGDEVREIVKRMAEEYHADPKRHGTMYFTGLTRGQFGKNNLASALEVLYPEKDWTLNVPTIDEFDAGMLQVKKMYGNAFLFLKGNRSGDYGRMEIEEFPDSYVQRKALADSGYPPEVLVTNTAGEFVFWGVGYYPNYHKDLEENPSVVMNDVRFTPHQKIRVISAGSIVRARADQSYIQEAMEKVYKNATLPDGKPSVPSYHGQLVVQKAVEAMFDSVSEELGISVSGNDKTLFDNFIKMIMTILFPAAFITPLFKDPGAKTYWKHSVVTSFFLKLLTFRGIYEFVNVTSSGDTITESKGSSTTVIGDYVATEMAMHGIGEDYDILDDYAKAKASGVTPLRTGDDALNTALNAMLESYDEGMLTEDGEDDDTDVDIEILEVNGA